MLSHPAYKVTCMLDHAAMVTVSMAAYGVFDCKPLGFLWAKFPDHYNADNTIMFDDLRQASSEARRASAPVCDLPHVTSGPVARVSRCAAQAQVCAEPRRRERTRSGLLVPVPQAPSGGMGCSCVLDGHASKQHPVRPSHVHRTAPRRRNFVMNPQNGLKIRPYKRFYVNRETDRELLHLTR